MKKSILTVITLALVLINMVLTVVMALTIMPQVKKANALVDKVASAIDLDVKSASGVSGNAAGTSLSDTEQKRIPAEEGKTLTLNLASDANGEKHYGSVYVTLLINPESDSYDSFSEGMGNNAYEGIITREIQTVCVKYTAEEMQTDLDDVEAAILERLRGQFGDDYIVGVKISGNYQ